ncbi:MAG: cysteine desulfurase / selenocysteine lyase [Candidatus Woesearchaeota archaeon]|nr:cysteine desulfurase / selenocysteine lyase [Candidatus Woesearchaeota archaeon]MDN5328065.1 cysteine desulfurase / selenocysteine lyase [Candidatus Woesearchaeota archaeon]
MSFNVEEIRKDFPILKDVIFFDNAASTQKPLQVIESVEQFYKNNYANVLRGVYKLSEKATELYEQSRKFLADFFGVKSKEVIFTKNSTESLNLLADSLTRMIVKKKGMVKVLISVLEHHSNIVPWFIAKERYENVEIEFVGLNQEFKLDEKDFLQKVKGKDIVSLTGLSNVTGYVTNPKLFEIAKKEGAITICDGAQLVPHHKVNLDYIDFLVFSGHKMLAPVGIGVLIGKQDLLEEMPCFLGGGEMISQVNVNNFKAAELPYKFEAGTMPFVQAYGLMKALEYLNKIGFDNIVEHEKKLVEYALQKMKSVKNITIYGSDLEDKTGIIAFNHKRFHAHDVASFMDMRNIAIRAGHHCAMPLHEFLNINGSARVSFYFYNTFEEVDKFIDALNWINAL